MRTAYAHVNEVKRYSFTYYPIGAPQPVVIESEDPAEVILKVLAMIAQEMKP